MRLVLVLVLLAAAAATVGWTLLAGSDDAPPPTTTKSTKPAFAPAVRAPAVNERSSAPWQRPPPSAADATPPTSASHPDPATDAKNSRPITVTLVVRDLATRHPVPSFRWRFRIGAIRERGEGTDGRIDLALPSEATGELLVEADDLAPFVQTDYTVPTMSVGPAVLDVFLRPAIVAAGITLLVHDTALQPIAHVRVDAFPVATETREGGWHLDQALWARRADASDGRYTLPPLPAGEYGIRVVATDADGGLLPLLPYVHTFALTGDNGFLEDVALEPGTLPVLELVDLSGQALAPGSAGTVTLQLHLPGGPLTPRRWVVMNDGSATTAVDTLPGKAPTWPAEAVPASIYALEVHVAGELRLQRTLMLRVGERQVERIVVP
ncbi:MAG: hypothetical protein ABIP94_25085 [Planctomycetota bacterium]